MAAERALAGSVAALALASLGGALYALANAWQQVPGRWIEIAGACIALALLMTLLATALHRWRQQRLADALHRLTGDSTSQQHELAQLREQLEHHQRTQRDLVEAKRTAEAAVMAKGEFLATMSHEIRTPLNGIIPMLDLLQGSGLRADQSDLVGTAFASARQLLRIVDDILDYSKLEASKLELETVGVNLKELLTLVMRLLEKPAEGRNLRLELRLDPGLRLAVRSDPTRLRQVLSNLLSNAIKFTERGSVTLSATRKSETRSHHLVRFEVRDTGIGIDPEAAARLFQAFSQADASTTRLYGGTGLGLAISQRIVRLMGGTIGVDSEPGRGSLFWFEVPLLKAVGDIASTRVELNGARALVLTSEPQLQRRLHIALPNWGVQQTLVGTTQEAINRLRGAMNRGGSASYQLLIADLGSIRTTAIGLHRNIRRATELDLLRIVYLRGDDPAPDELLEPGRSLVLPRTLSDAELRVALSDFLAHDGASAPADAAAADVANDLEAPAPVAKRATPRRLHGRVLLVEDNPVNRMVAQRLLDLMGLICETAENGKQAIERLVDGQYDAVLMDCQMPIMDGYGATRLWREHEEQLAAKRLPIIAMTANAMAGDRQKCLAAGMDDYLPKPVTRDQMADTLARWIPQLPEPAAPPAPMPAPPAVARSQPVMPSPRQPVAHNATASLESPGALPPLSTQFIRGPAIEREVLDELRAVMGEDFKSLISVFIEDAPGHLAHLEAAALAGDLPGMVASAHTLKSASANLGAMALSELARTIEAGARQQQLAAPELRVARLAQELYRASDELRRLL